MKKTPKNWYIQVTEENQDIVSKWRLTQATSFTYQETIAVGQFVMSYHTDGSCYYGSYSERKLNNEFPSHESIDFETFLEITGMKTTSYTVTREQFLEGYELACGEWQRVLTDKFSIALLKSYTIEVDEEFIKTLREAVVNKYQQEFLDRLFPPSNFVQPKDLEIGEAMRITDQSSVYFNSVVLRTYDCFVDVNNPNSTWNGMPSFRGVRVKLKIEVEEC